VPLMGNRRLARRLGDPPPIAFTAFDLRCAGHEYLGLAAGAVNFAFYNRLHPWDHAAGQLLHREAGGFAAQLDGAPYTPRATGGGLLVTPDEASWRLLRAAMIDPLNPAGQDFGGGPSPGTKKSSASGTDGSTR
jgi:hypothetical protein